MPPNLINLKTKLDKLHVDKLIHVPVDLSKLSDVVKNDAVKKDVYNAKIKNIEDKIPNITNLATKTTLNAKINEVKGEIPRITDYLLKLLLMKLKRKLRIIVIININILLLQNLIVNIRKFCCKTKASKFSKQK